MKIINKKRLIGCGFALAAGMNAHVTKPIDMIKLYDVLGKCFH